MVKTENLIIKIFETAQNSILIFSKLWNYYSYLKEKLDRSYLKNGWLYLFYSILPSKMCNGNFLHKSADYILEQ